MQLTQNQIIGIGVFILIILGVWWFMRAPQSSVYGNQNLQQQLENSPELKEVVQSPRNNFTSGSYSLDTQLSKVSWKYGEKTGVVSLKNGSMSVLPTGRIEGFQVTTTLDTDTLASIKSAAGITGDSTVTMKASTVLPNTVDDAFTIAFSLDGLGKSTSLATGMFVTKTEAGIEVKGDITIDPKTLGVTTAESTLTISPLYIFK